jgi:hypothetical protein
MSNLINECIKINDSLNNHIATEEFFPTGEQPSADEIASDDRPSVFAKPPIEFDEEAEASYKSGRRASRISEKMLRKCVK